MYAVKTKIQNKLKMNIESVSKVLFRFLDSPTGKGVVFYTYGLIASVLLAGQLYQMSQSTNGLVFLMFFYGFVTAAILLVKSLVIYKKGKRQAKQETKNYKQTITYIEVSRNLIIYFVVMLSYGILSSYLLYLKGYSQLLNIYDLYTVIATVIFFSGAFISYRKYLKYLTPIGFKTIPYIIVCISLINEGTQGISFGVIIVLNIISIMRAYSTYNLWKENKTVSSKIVFSTEATNVASWMIISFTYLILGKKTLYGSFYFFISG